MTELANDTADTTSGQRERGYMVLHELDDGRFERKGAVDAINAREAVKRYAAEGGPGKYYAVPVRSWVSYQATIEQQPRVRVD